MNIYNDRYIHSTAVGIAKDVNEKLERAIKRLELDDEGIEKFFSSYLRALKSIEELRKETARHEIPQH